MVGDCKDEANAFGPTQFINVKLPVVDRIRFDPAQIGPLLLATRLDKELNVTKFVETELVCPGAPWVPPLNGNSVRPGEAVAPLFPPITEGKSPPIDNATKPPPPP